MRLLSWIVALPLFFAVIVFVLQNRMQVSLSFWPFDAEVAMPVSVLAIGLLCLGFLAGTLVGAVSMLRYVGENRKLKRDVASLNKKVQEASTPVPCVPAILTGGRYQAILPEGFKKPKSRFFKR